MVFPAFTPLCDQHSEKRRRCQTFLPARTSLPTPKPCKKRVKCSDCISPARARLCVHGTQNHAQNPAQNRECNTDSEAVQRPFADRFGAHRRRLLEAQEQDQTDQRELKRQNVQPGRRFILLLVHRCLHCTAAVWTHDRLVYQLFSALIAVFHLVFLR